MNTYKVSWKIIDGGEYVPPDPCCGGDYFSDKYGMDIITINTKKAARNVVKKARPSAKIMGVEQLN